MIPRDLGGSELAMSPTTVVVSGAGTAVELSAVAVMLQSREGGQKKLVKKVTPWLPYMGVAQTNLPIEAMLKFEFVSIMTPSNTGLGSMFLVIGGGPFRKFPNPKEQIRHLDSRTRIFPHKPALPPGSPRRLIGSRGRGLVRTHGENTGSGRFVPGRRLSVGYHGGFPSYCQRLG